MTQANLELFPIAPTGPPPSGSCSTDTDCGACGPCLPALNQCVGAFNPDSSCIASDYATPELAFAPLPGSWSAKLGSIIPDGSNTPMTPALQGVHTLAKQRAQAEPTHRVAVVLLTDGEPTGCTTNAVNDVAMVATTALSATPSVPTHVVAVGINPATLNLVAVSGGTGAARNGGASGNAVQAEIQAIVRAHACRMPKAGAVSFQVSLKQAASTTPLSSEQNASCTGMGFATDGGDLVLCSAACDAFLSAPSTVEATPVCP